MGPGKRPRVFKKIYFIPLADARLLSGTHLETVILMKNLKKWCQVKICDVQEAKTGSTQKNQVRRYHHYVNNTTSSRTFVFFWQLGYILPQCNSPRGNNFSKLYHCSYRQQCNKEYKILAVSVTHSRLGRSELRT